MRAHVVVCHVHKVLVDLGNDAFGERLRQRVSEVAKHCRWCNEDQSIKGVLRQRRLELAGDQRRELAFEFAPWIGVRFHAMTAVAQ
jgi:hypothetical protein